MLLNERLRFLREQTKSTQKQVADYLGVDVSTYAHYEAGRRVPDIDKLRKLAEKYNMTDELLGAELPITIRQTFERTDLIKLEQAISDTEWIKGDYSGNKEKYEKLRTCAEPVLKEWERSLDLPNIDISYLPANITLKRVELDVYAEALIKAYLDKCDNFFKLTQKPNY